MKIVHLLIQLPVIDIINTYTLSIPLLPKYGLIVLVGNRKPKLQIIVTPLNLHNYPFS